MKWLNLNEIIEYINNLENYEGFVRFSHRPIQPKDIFKSSKIKIEKENGFIVEAFFCNGIKSIEIKHVNDRWLVSEIILPQKINPHDIDIYKSKVVGKVKMLQIWEEVEDSDFEEFKVKKLKNVVFYGFEGDKDESAL